MIKRPAEAIERRTIQKSIRPGVWFISNTKVNVELQIAKKNNPIARHQHELSASQNPKVNRAKPTINPRMWPSKLIAIFSSFNFAPLFHYYANNFA
jgi:hypothetical protein